MKTVVLRSLGGESGVDLDYSQEFDHVYASRVIGNLRNAPGFCSSCVSDCTSCRKDYDRTFADDLVAVIDLPDVMPYILENPASYVPASVPEHEVLIIINIHEQVLIELLKVCKGWGTRAVIVPLEEPHWISGAAKEQSVQICSQQDIEIDFPKPFCAFKPADGTFLAQFRDHFHIGYPEVELTIEDRTITKTDVKVSAACGATYYIAKWLKGRNLDENLEIDVIAKRLSSFPCTASMERDPELDDDTPMHIAGQAHYAILAGVKDVMAPPSGEMMRSPTGKMIPRPKPAKENIDNIDAGRAMILKILEDATETTIDATAKQAGLSFAAVASACLLLKKDGLIATDGRKIIRTGK